jgi:hypothetical protein
VVLSSILRRTALAENLVNIYNHSYYLQLRGIQCKILILHATQGHPKVDCNWSGVDDEDSAAPAGETGETEAAAATRGSR